jgi:outer membrane receptor protein involved in Fe transport
MPALPIRLKPVALLVALTLSPALPVRAEDVPAPVPDTSKSAGPNLDAVVVTGTSQRSTVMKSSVSISTISDEAIEKAGATNATELLRSVPGVHSESSGGEGNANVTVRGVPISAGGSRYVQFQEDGLPILLFGDNAFATPDEYLRVDGNVDHLEVIRGGSAGTLASNAPGGIINFVSKHGEDQGGAVGLSTGVDFREQRVDFDYGGKIAAKTHFHLGGFFRNGEGPRPAAIQAENGGQLKGNITQDLDNGYVRLNFKLLDDKTPTFLPVPVAINGGSINPIAGIDPRTAYFIGSNFGADRNLNKDGGQSTTATRDGLHVQTTALGAEAHFDLADGFSIDEKFRRSQNSGRFIGLFAPGGVDTAGGTFSGVLFNTTLDDMGNTFNDLRLSKKLAAGELKANLVAGLFNGMQTVAQTWDWNNYAVGLSNSNPRVTQTGTGTTTFGNCCVRSFNVQYTNTSPYLALNLEQGPLSIDASLRNDRQQVDGYQLNNDTSAAALAANGGINLARNAGSVGYSISKTGYSVGGNYQLDHDMAVFARTSRGYSFIADRLLYNGNSPVDGSAPINFGEVKQHEIGVKYRTGGFNLFVTLFKAQTAESNYDLTTQVFSNNSYDARGVEVEAGYRVGDFHISGGATLTNSEITNGSNSGHTPQRLAHLIYQLAPAYSIGSFDVGAQIVGTTDSYVDDANSFKLPAYTVVNGFLNYQYDERTRLSLTANNLFNQIGYTEASGPLNGFGNARSINGRTVRAALKYSF